MNKSLSRENALRTIYSKCFGADNDGLEVSDDLTDYNVEFYDKIIDEYTAHFDEITAIINANLKGIVISRVYKVDLALIYLALTELKYFDTPKKVVINEVLELAKKYSTEKSSKFINGFLATVVNNG